MAIAKIDQAAHRQTLRVHLSSRRKCFEIAAKTLARFIQRIFAQIAHHPERMHHPINNVVQKRLPHLTELMKDNGDAAQKFRTQLVKFGDGMLSAIPANQLRILKPDQSLQPDRFAATSIRPRLMLSATSQQG
ncbi:MAG TPA: hypothetical protein VF493_06750 [Terriglobales bacterium]